MALLAGGAASFLLTGCDQHTLDQFKRLGLPTAITNRAPIMEHLWIGSWIAAFAVGFLVWGLIIFAAVHYRRRHDDDTPPQTRYNLPLEMLYTVAPVIIIAVLFFYTVKAQDKIESKYAHPQERVYVTAQQWSWTFSYLDQKSIGGKDVYDIGNPAREPTLWLVKGAKTTFYLHSPDVIHSFWIPEFYFKLDVIPGRLNSFSVTPTRLGTYEGHCAELCGYLHSRMLFEAKIVTRAQFDAHVKQLAAAGQIGKPTGGSEANVPAGDISAEHGGPR